MGQNCRGSDGIRSVFTFRFLQSWNQGPKVTFLLCGVSLLLSKEQGHKGYGLDSLLLLYNQGGSGCQGSRRDAAILRSWGQGDG